MRRKKRQRQLIDSFTRYQAVLSSNQCGCRLRLLALQQELAQLKRTPSMQLLARQRIPRLEKAIKHLIACLAASA